jgi:hypothetical protein
MAEKRLRGDQCFIKLIQNNGVAQETWKAVASFDITTNNSVLEEEFLGETAKRFDAIFDGYEISCEAQMFSTDEEALEDAIIAKNQRRGASAAQRFDITVTTVYPSGQTTTRVLEDVEFGPIKTSIGGRSDYVKISFEGKCSTASRIAG